MRENKNNTTSKQMHRFDHLLLYFHLFKDIATLFIVSSAEHALPLCAATGNLCIKNWNEFGSSGGKPKVTAKVFHEMQWLWA